VYKVRSEEFEAPNGQRRKFFFREDTNDRNTIVAAFCEDEYRLLELDYRENGTVVDIGAHIGAVTLLFSTIRPDLKIFAVEPMRENFELLRRNIQENDLENEVNIFEEAVWFYDDDKIELHYGDSSKDGRIHKFVGSIFLIDSFRRKDLFRTVHTVSLSKFFEDNRICNCRVLKLDVEGAEYGILKAAPKGVLEMIDYLIGEYHNIDREKIKFPRKCLLDQTKGVFRDVSSQPETGRLGPFRFVKI
jgi:FkbM family methyltransferase